ncbi:HNH endonuclease [Streptomyces sp. NPDC050600]|uniref:HNH endonuclease n=1 Tax=Streptomyces sp. NPDC050600 TaxID=3157213 RepID=UPI00344A9842
MPYATRRGDRLDWVRFDFELARDGSIEPTDKALYAAISSFVDAETRRSSNDVGTVANDVSEDVPTRQRLAECIGKSVSTVDRCIKSLEQRGLLKVHRRRHPDNPKVFVPSEYELLPYQPQPRVVPAVIVPPPRKRVPISEAKRARVLTRDGHSCRGCGANEDLTIDHIKHWSRGGSNADDNLRVLCRSCNSKRSDGSLDGVDA